VIPYLTIALAVCSLFATAYMNFVRPARKRRKAELAAPVIAAPEPELRAPRDPGRPYPRPKGGRRKLDKTCPVCGTGPETTALDGKILGWPAHASCAEWLGEHWRPARPAAPPFSPDKQLIGYIEQGQKPNAVKRGTTYSTYVGTGNLTASELAPPPPSVSVRGSTDAVHYAGGTAITVSAWDAGAGGSTSEDVMAWLANGLISTDEARLRLNAEMLSGFALPGPDVGNAFTRKACPDCGMEFSGTADAIDTSLYVHRKEGQCEQRRKKRAPAAPVFPEYCTCGWSTTIGTALENRRALDAHHASGECPHSAKGRAAGWPKPNFAPNNPTGPLPPDTRP
jgi:hypothetical protein